MPSLSFTLAYPLPAELNPARVTTALQRYEPLITANPYLVSYHRRPVDVAEIVEDPFFREDGQQLAAFEVVDRIVLVPGLATKQVVIPCVMQRFDGGLRCRSLAAGGVRVWSTWRVLPAGVADRLAAAAAAVDGSGGRRRSASRSRAGSVTREKDDQRRSRSHSKSRAHSHHGNSHHGHHGHGHSHSHSHGHSPSHSQSRPRGASVSAGASPTTLALTPPETPPKDDAYGTYGTRATAAPNTISPTSTMATPPPPPPPGGYELVEEARVECGALVKPFVGRSFREAHLEILRKVVDQLLLEEGRDLRTSERERWA